MKKLFAIIALSFLFAPTISAHEGLVDLTTSDVSCKGVSIYKDGYYNVSGRCDGLVYPYETTYNKYVLWGKTASSGQMTRIAEIDKGYFSGNIASSYDAMYISAEKNGLVRKMSEKIVAEGKVNPFSFDKSQVTTAPSTTTAVATKTVSNTTTPASTGTAGAVVGKIVTSLLVVILVIVGLAIGASLLFRSRGSVSA